MKEARKNGAWIKVMTPQERLQTMIDALNEIDAFEASYLRATTALETVDNCLEALDEQDATERARIESNSDFEIVETPPEFSEAIDENLLDLL